MNRIDMVNEGVRLMLRHRDTSSAVEAILDMAEPLFRADERRANLSARAYVDFARAVREEIVADIEAAWRDEGHAVMFNHAHDDLTPQQRVGKWLAARIEDES